MLSCYNIMFLMLKLTVTNTPMVCTTTSTMVIIIISAQGCILPSGSFTCSKVCMFLKEVFKHARFK